MIESLNLSKILYGLHMEWCSSASVSFPAFLPLLSFRSERGNRQHRAYSVMNDNIDSNEKTQCWVDREGIF